MADLFALNLGSVLETDNGRRILSATYDQFAPAEQPRVTELPEGDISNYLYSDTGEYVLDPLPEPEDPPESIDIDKLEAQATYTAMMTDTLLPEGA